MEAVIDNMLITSDYTPEQIEGLAAVDIPAEFPRQSGKTTTVVHTVEDILIFVTRIFDKPIRIGIFAPQTRQARTDFTRLKNALLKSQSDLIAVSAEERKVQKELSNAHEIVLGDGSVVMIYPVTSASKPEGETFDLIIVEESQDVDDTIMKEQILPMGASTNAPVIWIGTAGTKICTFYEFVNKPGALVMDYLQVVEDRRRLYNIDHDAKHLIYEYRVKSEIAKYGEQSDEIQRPYFNKWLLGAGMYVSANDLYACRVDKPYEDPKADPVYVAYMDWYREHYRTAPEIDTYQSQNNISDADMARYRSWSEEPHYFGLDTAKELDKTVLKIGRVIDGQLTTVRSIDNLRGVNYEDQFEVIVNELKYFNVAAGAIDSTGQGDFMPDKFERNTSYRIARVKFSLMSKDVMYKGLYQKIVNRRFGYHWQDPAKSTVDIATADSANEFEQEMLKLVKEYKGEYMSVHHPDNKNAHDDHADSTALMSYAYDQYNITSGISDYYADKIADERAEAEAIAEANRST